MSWNPLTWFWQSAPTPSPAETSAAPTQSTSSPTTAAKSVSVSPRTEESDKLLGELKRTLPHRNIRKQVLEQIRERVQN